MDRSEQKELSDWYKARDIRGPGELIPKPLHPRPPKADTSKVTLRDEDIEVLKPSYWDSDVHNALKQLVEDHPGKDTGTIRDAIQTVVEMRQNTPDVYNKSVREALAQDIERASILLVDGDTEMVQMLIDA